ncbi:spore coat protein S [Gracilibacillus boraciitolerans JCM 21714]|uniref:Spore coat protein S n=1 Tax=Gracilibacillus boraciitolerans JCM 21714 TaxID=1298598 RepID=W4VMM2_9BACI|nr:hypothetical protein [Gracilibacillus boraciitolerans]GAE93989.1 spore coat protein S [Gracilibacillus boraciitolerans JCM 21714]
MHPIFLHYPIQVPTKQVSEKPYLTFLDQSYYYFVIPTNITERYALELYTIASHFHQQGWPQVTCPIPNVHDQFITMIGKDKYMLCYALENNSQQNDAAKLSSFHRAGFAYPYQPSSISSYGKWKELWIAKIDQYEALYQHLYQKRPASFFVRDFVNIFPYIVGIAENAIQYMNQVEKETRFHEYDQPTIVFGRYHTQLNDPFIWCNQFVFDHPVRDMAEKLRSYMSERNGISSEQCKSFIQNYTSDLPLSVFGWKLLYARLIYPIHLLEIMDQIQSSNENIYSFEHIIENQNVYEENLSTFFHQMGIDDRSINSIQLDWLWNL